MLARLTFDTHHVRHTPQHMADNLSHGVRGFTGASEAHRHGGDAAVHPFGQQSGQYIDASQGVTHTLCICPIRGIHILLDRYAMEGAVGKGVQREDVGVERLELRLKGLQNARFVQAESGLPR